MVDFRATFSGTLYRDYQSCFCFGNNLGRLKTIMHVGLFTIIFSFTKSVRVVFKTTTSWQNAENQWATDLILYPKNNYILYSLHALSKLFLDTSLTFAGSFPAYIFLPPSTKNANKWNEIFHFHAEIFLITEILGEIPRKL